MESKVKLKEVTIKIGSGSTPRGGKGSYLDSGDYRLIRSQNVYNHFFEWNGLAYISELQAEKLKNVNVEKEDILINITGDSVARNMIATCDYLPARVNQHVAIIRCDKNKLDPYYLSAILTSKRMQQYLLSLAQTGGTRAALTKSMLENLEIPLLDLKKQNSIGMVLKIINNKIEINKKIILNLEQLAQTLFKRWFVDFEFPNENGDPFKSSGGEMVESELGMIPVGWEVVKIKDICMNSTEHYSPKEDWSYVNYLDTGNITGNNILNIQHIDTAKQKVPSRARRKVQANDIIYSTVRPNQKHYGLIREPLNNMLVSTGFAILRTKGMYPSNLLFLWLTQKEMTDKLHSIAEQSTSAYPSIKSDDIMIMKILQPSQDILDSFDKIIGTHYKMIWNLQQENKRLSTLRDMLLPKLLSGEIELPEETEVTEDVPIS